MNSTILFPHTGKIVGQTGLFSLGLATVRRKEKSEIKPDVYLERDGLRRAIRAQACYISSTPTVKLSYRAYIYIYIYNT